jgi:hypothetical protein
MPKCKNLEGRIIKLNKSGKTNRQIAKELGCHRNTVKYWLKENNLKSPWANEPIDIIGDDLARCRKCKREKSILEFQHGRKGQKYEYKFSYCNDCRRKQVYLNLNSSIEKFLANSINRKRTECKKKGIEFNLTKKFLLDLYEKQDGLCFYTDRKMVWKVGEGKSPDALSIDRVVFDKGYTIGNVVLCSNRINAIKRDVTLEEMKEWMPNWYKKIKEGNK